MKRIYRFILLLTIASFISNNSSAQCGNGRYLTEIFDSVIVTSDIQYGSNIAWTGGVLSDLFLDVYTPDTDTVTERPLVVFVHDGSLVGGSKTGADVVSLANDFAKMGYVSCSIGYRLGMNTLPPDSLSFTEATIRGMHDLRASIRFFRKDVAVNGNTYGIDSNKIMVIGIGSGAMIAMQHTYLDDISELPSYVNYTDPGLGGGLEGTSGNNGYSSGISAVVNICGALIDTSWITPGDEPILSMHHALDDVMPYGQDAYVPFFNIPIKIVNGSDPIHVKADQEGLINCFHTYTNVSSGMEHAPHIYTTDHYDTTLAYVRNFLYQFSCGGSSICGYPNTVNIGQLAENDSPIKIYPNPAANFVTIELEKSEEIKISNVYGQHLITKRMNQYNNQIDISSLPPGFYFIQIADKAYPLVVK